jgi:hypothetical protein
MKTLITLSLRLFASTSGQDRRSAKSFLKAVREAILQWIFRLRDELRKANEADAAARFARYGFCAALLCSRTFAIFTELNSKMIADDGQLLTSIQNLHLFAEYIYVNFINGFHHDNNHQV